MWSVFALIPLYFITIASPFRRRGGQGTTTHAFAFWQDRLVDHDPPASETFAIKGDEAMKRIISVLSARETG